MPHGGRPRVRRLVTIGLALLAVMLILSASPATARPISGSDDVVAPSSIRALAHCSGPSVTGSYLGTLTIQGGGSFPPTVKNRTVVLAFTYELNFTPNGGSPVYSCKNGTVSASTGLSGGFSATLPVPSSSCNSVSCSTYTGPFGPVNVSVAGGPPAGYFLTSSVQGSTVGLAFVAALSRASLDPASRVTLSTDAPTVVHASAQSGNGGPSPAVVGFDWRISGTGWSLLNGTGSANVTIDASVGASPGVLEVWVNGSYNGTSVAAPLVTLGLAAASTKITAAGVVPTTLDVDLPATFTVIGTGAGGYPYDAAIVPGLNEPDVVAPCTTASASGGLVTLTCSVSVTYSTAGTAQPSANLTNGYSTDARFFSALTISSALVLRVDPSPSVRYPGDLAPVTVSVAGGTGTEPFGPACVWPGDGRLLCDAGPGPSYSFPLSFGPPGTYAGRATVEDASGANVSVPWETDVFARPSLDPLLSPNNSIGVGGSLPISSAVSGGALPLAYWWNSSSPEGTLYQGTTDSDGSLVLDFVPHRSGLTNITLTIVDQLGTVVAEATRVSVTRGPPVAIGQFGGTPTWTTLAGSPYNVSWAAVDPVGEVVTTTTYPVTLSLQPTLAGRPVALWINASQGPVQPDANGSFVLAGSDWAGGFLNFTIDLGASGTFVFRVSAGLPVTDAPGGDRILRVSPDRFHVALLDPVVARSTPRSSDTMYRILDRFGDPLDGGHVIVRSVFNGVKTDAYSPVRSNATDATVWVNFTAPGPDGGAVYVLSEALQSLLEPIVVPPAVQPLSVPPYLLVLAGGVAAAFAAAFYVRRRRADRAAVERAHLARDTGATEEELKRLAEGRAHVLARADPEVGRTLDELAVGFIGPPPAPEELTEWVASLVAEGSLRTALGPDGRSRFLRVVRPEDRATVRVELDDGALQAALDRRNAEEPDDASDAPADRPA